MTLGGRALSIRGSFNAISLTAGEGPLDVYMTDKSLSLSEFEAYLEAAGPTNPEDTANAELATRGRRVRFLGQIVPTGDGTQGHLTVMDMSLSGLRFTRVSAGWQFVIYNNAIVLAGGATVRTATSTFIRWDKSN